MPDEKTPSYRAAMLYKEIGGTGTSVYNGEIMEEYLQELRGTEAVEVYDQMRRSDAQVKMALRAIKLPILQSVASIEASEDDLEMGDQIAYFCEKMLFDHMNTPWTMFMTHALMMLDFGYSVMEKVYEPIELPEALVDTGAPPVVLRLAKIAPRLPQTIYSWDGLDEGQLTGVTQRYFSGGKLQEYQIPIEKLVIFVNDREGDNWEGISLLRSAYKDWFIKDHLEKVNAMIHEKQGMGTPVWKIDPAQIDVETPEGQAVIDACMDISENLQANEKAGVVEVPGTEFRYETPSNSNSSTVLDTIKYHKSNIAISVILQFLELGQGESGSRAVAFEQRGPFDMSLLSIAGEIINTFNRFVLEELVILNFGPRPGYPKLTLSKISEKDLAPLVNMISQLISAQLIQVDNDLEDFFRGLLNLPPANEEERARQMLMDQVETESMLAPPEPEYEEPQGAAGEETKDLEDLKQKSGARMSKMQEDGHPVDWSYLLHDLDSSGNLIHAPFYDKLGNRYRIEHSKVDGVLTHTIVGLDEDQEVFWSEEEAEATGEDGPLVARQLQEVRHEGS